MTTPPPPPPPPSEPPAVPPMVPSAPPQWGAPLPQAPYFPLPPEPPRNGLGIPGMVLGIVGAVCGLVPFLFWVAAPLGIVALILGLVGLARVRKGMATHKGMSIAATALGAASMALAVLGVFLTIGFFHAVKKENDKEKARAEASAEATPSPDASDESDDEADEEPDDDRVQTEKRTLEFGNTARYKNGLKVTVAKPEETELSKYGTKEGYVAYKVTVTIENGTDKDVNLDLTSVSARDGDGAGVERTYDVSKGITFGNGITGRPHPGKSLTGTYVYLVPENKARDRMEVSVEPGVVNYKEATWSGSVK
ncbi:DUF4190 domain-containing protein [Streptomyces sp. ISL-11]|uniref:DUF4190 domain-containing protein n=1 Tax=Streptomyces sp. ISL-11 TaxID=2819174 RepID=UPI001BE866E0|nr:DUF4190 domain-containing protein [Streptomyces sp. ISL-11]MBT2384175.1 DUF4190 and DUF4352 domain-containing protein [Streptomyces sp. ISL-11]